MPRPAIDEYSEEIEALPAAMVAARLQERALALALVPPDTKDDAGAVEACVFRLGQERYAVPLAYVEEVLNDVALTPIPCTPAFICGVINVRGHIYSVTDLARFMRLQGREDTLQGNVVLVRQGTMETGILADEIIGTAALAHADLQPPPTTLTALQTQCLAGVTTSKVNLLDVEQLFAQEHLLVQEKER